MVVIATSLVVVPLLDRSREYDVRVDSYELKEDERQLRLNVTGGLGDQVSRATAVEEEGRVVVTVTLRQSIANKVAIGIPLSAIVVLQEPLAGRVVVDSTGQVVPRG